MRLLHIMDSDDYENCTRLTVRHSARAIIISDGRIAMIHSLENIYFKATPALCGVALTHHEICLPDPACRLHIILQKYPTQAKGLNLRHASGILYYSGSRSCPDKLNQRFQIVKIIIVTENALSVIDNSRLLIACKAVQQFFHTVPLCKLRKGACLDFLGIQPLPAVLRRTFIASAEIL